MHLAQYRLDSGTSATAITAEAGSAWATGAMSTSPPPKRRREPLLPVRVLPRLPRVDSAPLREEPGRDATEALRGAGTTVVAGARPHSLQ
ncbi:hypothetical protein Acsp01_05540 [Actinoplanes sp. NBRC 101535]|nr:hypothetical protein Acsp01_05540 [Actinoplanes sp. NBRC 101535]